MSTNAMSAVDGHLSYSKKKEFIHCEMQCNSVTWFSAGLTRPSAAH